MSDSNDLVQRLHDERRSVRGFEVHPAICTEAANEIEYLKRRYSDVATALEVKDLEIDRLNRQLNQRLQELDEREAAARWFRIVLTNMTQGEQMYGVYERWPWLKEEE